MPAPRPVPDSPRGSLCACLRGLSALVLLASLTFSGCGRSGAPAGPQGLGPAKLQVAAAESFWGDIAAQLAGDRAVVQSILVNPATDPHSYEPNAADARAFAGASMVIVNGLGYDNWASQLLQASPQGPRVVLNVGHALGLADGANPHRWYYPSDVRAVVQRIAADYERLDPADAAYFAAAARRLETHGLARYEELRREIRARYAGVPVGYSESIFKGLGEDLGLRLLTPSSFANAVAEGTDVTAKDKASVDAQARDHQIKLWVLNSQNVTPDVQRVTDIARERQIPIATITETLSPPSASFQQWQVSELEGLLRALRRAVGR
jgi:zinc/manganese transport system substrate-binding protein